jgi:serine phosphatase RsbU (regulator of sigma subunit)
MRTTSDVRQHRMMEYLATTALIAELEDEIDKLRRLVEDRERERKRSLAIAAQVHQSLLPGPVRHPMIDVETRYVPMATIGGDYCQVRFPTEELCYITLSDVTGHSVQSALLAARVSSEVRQMIRELLSPRDIIERLNRFIIRHFADAGLMLSFLCVRIDLHSGRLVYSGAGHPPALLWRDGQRVPQRLVSQNMLIGVQEDCLDDDPQTEIELGSGDRVLLYTDGLIEATNAVGQQLGEDGLSAIAAAVGHHGIVEYADAVLGWVQARQGGPVRDDTTLIVADYRGRRSQQRSFT